MKNLKNEKYHVLIALIPGQGQINPCLQFSKLLINLGIEVTLTTSLSAFISRVEFIFNLIQSNAKKGTPISHVVYTTIMEWVGVVAKKINISSTIFWIQPAIVFYVYYYRLTDYSDYFKNCDAKDKIMELQGFPPLSPIDFPSFVFDDMESIKKQIEMLNSEENPRVLVNTFDTLEFDALRILKHVTMIGIVQLMEEIGQGLLKCGRPFLWVIRKGQDRDKMEDKLSSKDELEMQGKIVNWCSQVESLKHPSGCCFLTHCRWNSTLESIASGYLLWHVHSGMIKFVTQNSFKIFGRMVLDLLLFNRCIEIAIGGSKEGKELRRNAKKWSNLVNEATKKNGTSIVNLQAFVNEIILGHNEY
ncbi:hypothetical protein R3W88_008244 [Solanum pinnatisectum]|uniref:Uncharacterized protein n=1 Tax=Solanum pinnatisectum TaxID=50273 RepID=A0AAV9M8B9_9SOLN|nr:hypothetical protein R3W88_008244 [Solanum pinnatisectum]